LYADPPWAYNNWKRKLNGAAQSHYPTVNHKTMCGWPVGELAADDSLIFMWATFPKLPEALEVLEAWGFKYVTTPFVWVKTYADGRPTCGVGFWTRCGAEVVLLGRRGKGLTKRSKSVRQVFLTERRPHSAKPPEMRYLIQALVGDVRPRIELFSRNPEVEGWTHTGLEADGRTIEEAVEYYKEI
jgi:N6-adenosine-specific RNA methylase IME4